MEMQFKHMYMVFLKRKEELIEFNGEKAIYRSNAARWPIELLACTFNADFIGKRNFLYTYGVFNKKINI